MSDARIEKRHQFGWYVIWHPSVPGVIDATWGPFFTRRGARRAVQSRTGRRLVSG